MASRSGLPVATSHQEMSSFYIYIYMSLKRSLCIVHWRRLGGCGQHCYCQLCSNWSVSECQCCQLFRNDLSQIKHASNGNGCHRLKYVVQYSKMVPTSALSCHQIIHYYLFYYKHVFYQVVWLTKILKTAQQRESCMQLSSIVKHHFHVWVKEWGPDNSNNANGPPEPGACWCLCG